MPGRKHRRPHPHCQRGQQGGARRLEVKAPPIDYLKDEQQRQQELGILGRWVLVGDGETQNDFRSRQHPQALADPRQRLQPEPNHAETARCGCAAGLLPALFRVLRSLHDTPEAAFANAAGRSTEFLRWPLTTPCVRKSAIDQRPDRGDALAKEGGTKTSSTFMSLSC